MNRILLGMLGVLATCTAALASSDGDAATGGFMLLILLALYFLPGIIASCRKQAHTGAITALNLLLGWTLLGWVIAFVWACMNQPRQTKASVR